MKNNIFITAIILVVVAAAAFFGGMKYQEVRRGNVLAQGGNEGQGHGQFQRDQGGNRVGFRPVSGEIISQDDNSITVKLQDGSSKIVILSKNTAINKASTGAQSDLKTGERIAVFGTNNSDGSITAQNISIGGGVFQRGQDGNHPTGQ